MRRGNRARRGRESRGGPVTLKADLPKLTPEQEAARDKVRAFTEQAIKDVADELDATFGVCRAEGRAGAHLHRRQGFDTLCDRGVLVDDDGKARRPHHTEALCGACRRAAKAVEAELLAARMREVGL